MRLPDTDEDFLFLLEDFCFIIKSIHPKFQHLLVNILWFWVKSLLPIALTRPNNFI